MAAQALDLSNKHKSNLMRNLIIYKYIKLVIIRVGSCRELKDENINSLEVSMAYRKTVVRRVSL